MVRLWSHALAPDVWLRHLTAIPDQPLSSSDEYDQLLYWTAADLASREIVILREQLYCAPGVAADLVARRGVHYARACLDPNLPLSVIETVPCVGGDIAGLSVFGISGPGVQSCVRTLFDDDRPAGRVLSMGPVKLALLCGLEERGPPSARTLERLLARAAHLLRQAGLETSDTVRCWVHASGEAGWPALLESAFTRGFGSCDALVTPVDVPVQTPQRCALTLAAAQPLPGTERRPGATPRMFPSGHPDHSAGATWAMMRPLGQHTAVNLGASVSEASRPIEERLTRLYDELRKTATGLNIPLERTIQGCLYLPDQAAADCWQRMCNDDQLPRIPIIGVCAGHGYAETVLSVEIMTVD